MTTPGICPKHPKQRISKETTPKTGDKPNAPCSKHTKPEHRPGSGGFFGSLLGVILVAGIALASIFF